MTAGEGGSPSGGFSYPVWRSGDRLRRCRNPTRYARFRGPPEARSYKSRTAALVQEAVFANKTANYLIWLAPFTRVGSQVQSLPRPPSITKLVKTTFLHRHAGSRTFVMVANASCRGSSPEPPLIPTTLTEPARRALRAASARARSFRKSEPSSHERHHRRIPDRRGHIRRARRDLGRSRRLSPPFPPK